MDQLHGMHLVGLQREVRGPARAAAEGGAPTALTLPSCIPDLPLGMVDRPAESLGTLQASSRTPYRVSFAGGGTDLPAFLREEPGAVLSTTIDASIVVTARRRDAEPRPLGSTDRPSRRPQAIGHDLVREALRLTRTVGPLTVTIEGEVPPGTGMGSSSSLAVGLLGALYALRGESVAPDRLAREACRIEVEILGKPIGYQDQYAAAYGGLNYIRFFPDGRVSVEPVDVSPTVRAELERRVLLFFTGRTRDADSILRRQSEGTRRCLGTLRRLRDLAGEMRDALSRAGDLEGFGRLLHEGWILKRSLGFGISCTQVDDWYSAARRAGAQGGKLLGAGGGGFLVILAPPDAHDAIREALGRPPERPFRMSLLGCRAVPVGDDALADSSGWWTSATGVLRDRAIEGDGGELAGLHGRHPLTEVSEW